MIRLLALSAAVALLGCAARRPEAASLMAESGAGSTTDGTFAGVHGVEVAYRIVKPAAPTAAVVILSGYSESYAFYDEMITEFTSRGYAVYIMDNRGMGFSTRLADDRQIVHIDAFSRYVDDAELFITGIVRPAEAGPLSLFAHSTGGLIGAELLARRPELIARAVLSSPLLDVNTHSWPKPLAYSMAASAWSVGLGKTYATGYGDKRIEDQTFAAQTTTHSYERYLSVHRALEAHPDLLQSGPSFNWVRETIQEAFSAPFWASTVTTPILLTQAAEDTFVLPAGQDDFCARAAHCTLLRLEGSRHEAFRETDDIRDRMLTAVFAHLAGQ